MITLIHGRQEQLHHYFSTLAFTAEDSGNSQDNHQSNNPLYPLWLVKPVATASCWQPLRTLLKQIIANIGGDKVNAVLATDRAAASFVFDEQIDQLNQQQITQRHYYSARVGSHLSHNWYLHRPLLEAWATLLHQLLLAANEHQPVTLLAPFSAELTGPVNAILKTYSRLYVNNPLPIVMGFEIDSNPPEYDENGINWNMRSANPRFSTGFLQIADKVKRLTEDAIATPTADQLYLYPEQADTLKQDTLHNAFVLLTSKPNANIANIANTTVVGAMQLAFEGMDFQNTLKLGLQYLATQPSLNTADKASIHTLVALAAHNRQFDNPDTRFHHFLLHHLKTAYQAHTDASMRSALCYRLAVTYGRRMKQPQEALGWANQAISEADSPNLSEVEQVYYHNWGINIKSYLLLMSKQLEQAFDTGHSVFHSVHQHYRQVLAEAELKQNDDSRLWQRELFTTVQVLRRNMFMLSYKTSHLEQFRYWLDQMEQITEQRPELRRMTSTEWAEYYNAVHQPQKMLKSVTSGFHHYLAEPESELFLDYSRLSMTVHYKLGDIRQAKYWLEKYRLAIEETAMPWHFSLDISRFGHIYLRSSEDEDLTRIEQEASREFQSSQNDVGKQIELILLLAQVQAKRQLQTPTESLINKAIELALEDGERNQMMRIARIAALCNENLGHPQQAIEAYQQALSLAEHQEDIPPWPEELFLSLMGLQNLAGVQPQLMAQALQQLPEALKKHDSWWQLQTMLTLLGELATEDKAAFDALVERQPLTLLLDAAAQRQDYNADNVL